MIFGFGLVTAATAFVTNLAGFAASRGLLGVAEAGVLQTIYFQLSLFVRVPPRPGRRRRPPRAAPGP